MTITAKIVEAYEESFEVPDGAGGVRVDKYPALRVSYVDDEGTTLRTAAYCPRPDSSHETLDDVKAQIASEIELLERRAAKLTTAPPIPKADEVAAKVVEWDAKRGEDIFTLDAERKLPSSNTTVLNNPEGG